MKRPVFLSSIKFIVLVLAFGLLAGCAANMSKTQTVEERVDARWELILANDYAAAYEFLSPGYRSSVSSLQYQRSLLLKKVKWNAADYIESDCTDTACKVKISLKYTVYAAVPGVRSFDSTQTIEESWVLANGIWYLVPEV